MAAWPVSLTEGGGYEGQAVRYTNGIIVQLPLEPRATPSFLHILILIMAADFRPTLRDLIFHYPGFVRNPLQWTSRHFDLVGCRFEDMSTAPANKASPQDDCRGPESGSYRSELDAKMLANYLLYVQKRQSLVNILIGKKRAFKNYRQDFFGGVFMAITDNITEQKGILILFSRPSCSPTRIYCV